MTTGEYKLIFANSCHELSQEVTTALNSGWALYGNPFSDDVFVYQAITRYDETTI
jgi:hypothetical protein